MKKGKKILTAVGCVALTAVIGAGAWLGYVRQESKKYNLITLDEPDIAPVATPAEEYDIQLSEMTMHYAVYGDEGHDFILVRGNGGSKKSLEEAALYLANDYKVYVIESRCHGQSSDPDEISYELMARDIKEFCDKMKLDKPYLMGHSDGGINAITVAYMYPDLLGGFISCGANSVPGEFKPYFPLGVRIFNLINPSKLNDMMLTLPDIDEEKLAKITCPAYIVAGEYDIMWLSDTVFIHENIKDSKVAIIKGANHGSYISADGKQAYVLARDFFAGIE